MVSVLGKLEGVVTTPSGKKDKVKVSDNHDGTYDTEYTPKELGLFTLDVTFDNVPVPGSPFKFKVVKPGPRKVKVHGPGMWWNHFSCFIPLCSKSIKRIFFKHVTQDLFIIN